ncbi:hypothetical protein Q765_12585 [Flavobacterium rivuli WB 3.3-2 = DSM 21788]|uniref:Uncharacterized protein n=1 Tax=Flavobacterium rivuli WB 3.3-2 = DSM 21788 TaxID=1121895 RepID=A0A0A2M3Z9_9FLAO|nr:hypothetical protein [Flavobacterium rivuli]KGO86148.1 hypothetical protein Q765_12585 [Flavobacterium rivuli WB 3.3-2 = DSM 21788]
MAADSLKTTLFLIPGGQELSLPDNGAKFAKALRHSVLTKKAQIIMLADNALVPEETVQTAQQYKNVLLIESDVIVTEQDAWQVLEQMLEGHLPVISSFGFDYQVVQLEFINVKYEDFERLAKFM